MVGHCSISDMNCDDSNSILKIIFAFTHLMKIKTYMILLSTYAVIFAINNIAESASLNTYPT